MSQKFKTPRVIPNMDGGRAPVGMTEVRESRAPVAMTKVRDSRNPVAMTPVPSGKETASDPKPGDTFERGRGCGPMTPVQQPQQGGQQSQTPSQKPPLKK